MKRAINSRKKFARSAPIRKTDCLALTPVNAKQMAVKMDGITG